MRRNCWIVFSITRDKSDNNCITEVVFYNCFETEEQAKASLQYEADICKHENDEEVEWIDELTLKLPEGYDPRFETIVYAECSVDYWDKDEAPLKYE